MFAGSFFAVYLFWGIEKGCMRRRRGPIVHIEREKQLNPGLYYWLARAFGEFLALPSAIAFSGLALAVLFYYLDHLFVPWLNPLRAFLSTYIFTSPADTTNFMVTVTGGLMTVTSITISVLVIALQQSFSNMSERVFSQFIRRRINQVYFGLFVGAVIYSLASLSVVRSDHNSVFSASLDLILAVVSMYALILLLYTTMNQMNPEVIIGAIHDHTLIARQHQIDLVRKTLREATYDGPNELTVRAISEGYIARVNLDVIERAIHQGKGRVEVILRGSIGAYVSYQDRIADIEAEFSEDAERTSEAVRRGVDISRQRDTLYDAAFGLEQLENIGWSSISSAKSDPAPGLMVIRSAGDLLAHWVIDESWAEPLDSPKDVVYHDDVMDRLLDVLESAAVSSSNSKQHMSISEVYTTLMTNFMRMPPDLQRRVAGLLVRSLPALRVQILTATIETALRRIITTLNQTEYHDVAGAFQQTWEWMAQKAGNINTGQVNASPKENSSGSKA